MCARVCLCLCLFAVRVERAVSCGGRGGLFGASIIGNPLEYMKEERKGVFDEMRAALSVRDGFLRGVVEIKI